MHRTHCLIGRFCPTMVTYIPELYTTQQVNEWENLRNNSDNDRLAKNLSKSLLTIAFLFVVYRHYCTYSSTIIVSISHISHSVHNHISKCLTYFNIKTIHDTIILVLNFPRCTRIVLWKYSFKYFKWLLKDISDIHTYMHTHT